MSTGRNAVASTPENLVARECQAAQSQGLVTAQHNVVASSQQVIIMSGAKKGL